MISYNEHFCKGEGLWKTLCFECTYPKDKRDSMLIKEINKLRRRIAEKPLIIKQHKREITYLKKDLTDWIMRFIRNENKAIEVLNYLKTKSAKRHYKKVNMILHSSSDKYDEISERYKPIMLEDKSK